MNAPEVLTPFEPLGVIRASSWPSLFDCSYRWYWQNVVGLRMPSSGNAALGTAVRVIRTSKHKTRVLAVAFGVSVSTINRVRAGSVWSHNRRGEV